MSDATVSAIISSVLPIIFTLLFAWLSSRNDKAKRIRVFEEAKQRIELISAYVTSQDLVIDDAKEIETIKKTAANELYDIKAFLDDTLQSFEKSSEKSESYFMRFFLLYRMQTLAARFFRVLFFIVLFISIIWSIFIASISFTPDSVQEFGMGFEITMVVIASLPAVLIALLLRWAALKFDKPTVVEPLP
jgi:hypothetical protein